MNLMKRFRIVATVMAILGTILLAIKMPIEAQMVWFFGNLMWIYIGLRTKQYDLAILFTVYFLVTCIGLYNWLK